MHGCLGQIGNRLLLLSCCLFFFSMVGCMSNSGWRGPFAKEPKKPDSTKIIYDPDRLVIQATNLESKMDNPLTNDELQAAEELFKQKEYETAQKQFHAIAENKINPPLIAERARYLEAECLREQGYYPKAGDTYSRIRSDFEQPAYTQMAAIRMYEIANYWLQDTYNQLDKEREYKEKKRWFVPSNLIHWDRTKPLLDEEGRALQLMENAFRSHPDGPIADRALYAAAFVHFYRGHFEAAESLLSILVQQFNKSVFYAKAVEMTILCKNNATGGPDYDGRKSAEAMKLLLVARNNVPELANRPDFFDKQMTAIRAQQADKDMGVADFYNRTGRTPSAYYSYEVVRKRYPGTAQAERAGEEMEKIRQALARSQRGGFFFEIDRRWHKYVLGVPLPTLPQGKELPPSPLEGMESTPQLNPDNNSIPQSLPPGFMKNQ